MLHIVWRFRTTPEQLQEFLRYYKSDGMWAKLFRKSAEYHGTAMLHDIADSLAFLTVDRWSSNDAVARFRAEFETEYDQMDRHCQNLTQEEYLVGIYEDKGL
jgi:hypothetical protein